MKDCQKYGALLDPFVDGELTPEEMGWVQAHLEACPDCRAYVDDALVLRAEFPGVEDTMVPPDFAADVMERIRKESGTPKRLAPITIVWKKSARRRWAGSLAALAACCAIVILVWKGPAAPAENPAECAVSTESDRGDNINNSGNNIVVGNEDETGADLDNGVSEGTEAAPEVPAEEVGAGIAGHSARSEEAVLPRIALASPTAKDAINPNAEDYTNAREAAALVLTAEEAGELLTAFVPEWEDGTERGYRLSGEEIQALLETLEQDVELLETEEDTYLVIVIGPWEERLWQVP